MAPAHLHMLPLTLKVPLIRRLFELKAVFAGVAESSGFVGVGMEIFVSFCVCL